MTTGEEVATIVGFLLALWISKVTIYPGRLNSDRLRAKSFSGIRRIPRYCTRLDSDTEIYWSHIIMNITISLSIWESFCILPACRGV